MPITSTTLSGVVDGSAANSARSNFFLTGFPQLGFDYVAPPVRFGGAIYVPAIVGKSLGPPVKMAVSVWKTTDGGISWTELDTTHEPISSRGSTTICDLGVFYSGATIHIAFLVATVSGGTYTMDLRLIDFTMGPDTFGTVVTGGPNVSGATISAATMARPIPVALSTGDVVVAYNRLNPTTGAQVEVALSQYGAGVWSFVDTVIASGSQTGLGHIQVDTSDRTHIFFTDFSATPNEFQYRQWLAPTMGAPQVVAVSFPAQLGNTNQGINRPIYITASDTIAIPVITNASGVIKVNVVYGTPASAPVFTVSVVTLPSTNVFCVFLFSDVTQITQYIFWQLLSALRPILYSQSSDGGITWSAPNTFFAGNPPTTLLSNAVDVAITGLSAAYVSSTAFDVIVGADVTAAFSTGAGVGYMISSFTPSGGIGWRTSIRDQVQYT